VSPLIKKILHWTGSLLAFAGIIFVIILLNGYYSEINFAHLDGAAWSIIASLIMIYGFSNLGLALAWRGLLSHFGESIPPALAIKIYGSTQLAKYVPGNIMHLLGRQALGQAYGIRSLPLAKASIWELGLISIAGAFFLILILPQITQGISFFLVQFVFVIAMLVLVLGVCLFIGVVIAYAFGWYVLFLMISGILFVALLELFTVGEIPYSLFLPYSAAFIVAWLVGFITPGAPAGIGIREMVLIALLNEGIQEGELLLTVLVSRAVTVAGDVVFFLLSVIVAPSKFGANN
jgi:hypothetical protein